MVSGASNLKSLHFSTGDLPIAARAPFWQDVFGRHVVRLDIERLSADDFDADAALWSLPGLRSHWSRYSAPTRLHRPRELISGSDDNVAIVVDLTGTIRFSQAGSDVSLDRCAAVAVLHEKPATMEFPYARYVAIMAPLGAIRPLTHAIEDRAGRPIRADSQALQLLTRYVALLCSNQGMSDAGLSALAVAHVHDLMAVVLGATHDGNAIASERGVRAARLESIKSFVIENLKSCDLSVGAVASRHGLTPRYVHMLFEGEAVTFSGFVLEQRLLLVHRMLRSASCVDMSISTIAFASGFADLSHFNRSFRRRFGATPSDIRMAARV